MYSKIKEKGIPQAEIKEDCINILSDDDVIFKIDSKGGMFYSSDKKYQISLMSFMIRFSQETIPNAIKQCFNHFTF